MKYKKDLPSGVIGIERYVPGDISTRSYTISATSGTSGKKPTMFLKETHILSTAFYFTPEDRVLILRPQHAAVLSSLRSLFFHATFDAKDLPVLFLSKNDIGAQTHKLLDDFKPTAIFAPPSYFAFFVGQAKKEGFAEDLLRIKRIALLSEPMSVALKKLITDTFPDAEITLSYGTTESEGILGRMCSSLSQKYPEQAWSVYHPTRADLFIYEPDESGVGEIAHTIPSIGEYATGDLGKIIEDVCFCGEERTLFLYGRKDLDVLHSMGTTFSRTAVENILDPHLNHLFLDYQVEVSEEERGGFIQGQVTLTVLPLPILALRENYKDFLLSLLETNLFVSPNKTLGDMIREGRFTPARLELTNDTINNGLKIVRLRKGAKNQSSL